MNVNEIIIKVNEAKDKIDDDLYDNIIINLKRLNDIEELIQRLGTMHPILTFREQAIYKDLKEIMEDNNGTRKAF